MRLAFVADPNSIHTRRWVGWFASAGHDVRIIDPYGVEIGPGLPDGVVVERCVNEGRRLPLIRLIRQRRRWRRMLDRLGTQVLHAHFVSRFGWQAALSGFHPLVVSPWGSDVLRAGPRAIRTRLWNRVTLRSADLVTVSSEGMRRASIRAGALPERIRLIQHGVDMVRFAPGPVEPELARRIGADGSPTIFSPRSIQPLYRQEVVVDAVAMLAAGGLRPILVMSALRGDADLLAALRARATAAGIADRLRVLDDIEHADMPGIYRLADVIVSVPETDSFAVTLLEAMASGRPIVASDLPAVTPVLGTIDPVASELIVPVGDARATAAAIQRALNLSASARARLGAAMRDVVQRTADYDTNMAAMERLYRELAR